MINILLRVLLCIIPDIPALVFVSALVPRTRADTYTSMHDIGIDTEKHM